MGDRLQAGKPSWYVTSHIGQLSLAILSWVGAMSSSESWDVNRHTARCTSPVSGAPLLQDPTYINSCIPQLPPQTSGIYTPPPFFNHTVATQTDYQNSLRRPRFPMLCSCRLELSEH